LLGKPYDALDMAVRFPCRVEMRRLRRNTDVIDEARDNFVVPLASDALGGGGDQHGDGNPEREGTNNSKSMSRALTRIRGSPAAPQLRECGKQRRILPMSQRICPPWTHRIRPTPD